MIEGCVPEVSHDYREKRKSKLLHSLNTTYRVAKTSSLGW